MADRVYILREQAEQGDTIGVFPSFAAALREHRKLEGEPRPTWVVVPNGSRLVKVWHYQYRRIELWQVTS